MTARDTPSVRLAPRRPRRVVGGWVVYLVLLALSHAVQQANAPAPGAPPELPTLEVPMTDNLGTVAARTQRIAYRHWKPNLAESTSRDPVLLLHGSPGDGSNFARLGARLAAAGYEVFAPDLPGFGGSTKKQRSYSMRSHARAMLETLDALGIEQVHVAGWSQGGGVALRLAALAPGRVASLTLMASIGVQEAEGSGSYLFEHLKYGVGYAGLVLGGEALPHFGALGSHAFRRSFIRNFWDSDQRPLREIMASLDTPTLILHGRADFLAPLRAATTSHELIASSRLIVMDASHFLPIVQVDEVASDMVEFLDARSAGVPMERTTIERAPPNTSAGPRLSRAVLRAQQVVPWWVLLLACGMFALARPELAAGLLGFAVSMGWIDAGIACAGLFAGVGARAAWMWRHGRTGAGVRRARLDEPALASWHHEATLGRFGMMLRAQLQPRRRDNAATAMGQTRQLGIPGALGITVGAGLWTAVAFVAAMLGAILGQRLVPSGVASGLLEMLAGVVAAVFAAKLGVFAVTWTGRRRLLATLGRARRREFWPPVFFYAPVVFRLVPVAIRHRGLLTFTCANPVIGTGGGVVGESKHEIQTSLESLGASVMRTVLLDAGDVEARLATLNNAIADGRLSDAYPLVLKPDAGQRGYGVRIVTNERDARDYLSRMTRPVVAQEYHPGPIEIGVLWVRETDERNAQPGRIGRVFSVTAKAFPTLTADGTHTIEQLIYRHPRSRMQADMLLDRLAGRRLEIPERGTTVPLGAIGNHAMGAIFRDGADLLSPELEAWIDNAAASFRGCVPEGVPLPDSDNGLDFGRFDIRARSIDDLAAARGLGIIELNGTTAESTNIYDPDRSAWWAWGVLFRQWEVLFKLGAQRRAQGVRPMGLGELRAAWRDFADDRPDVGAAE
ncbi:MAG: alpha/beta fold hydrolase [Planctomycetota bacterium]|nr:alpha/beta fold hydrolase [Planctomycetota bacterium]